MVRWLVAGIFAMCFGLAVVVAQSAMRLQFELFEDGALLARPLLTIDAAKPGRLVVEPFGSITVTPTQRSPETIAIDFDIVSDASRRNARLTIGREPGSVSWTTLDGTRLEVRVTWVR
jgi:hypothetical protein